MSPAGARQPRPRGAATETVRLPIGEGFSLAAGIAGAAGAPRVVLVHGGAQSRRAWDVGVAMLVEAGYRAIALDMRGHGDSDWAPDGNYALEHWAEDLDKVVARLGAEEPGRMALVGASRGGQAALLTAVARPDLVSCVVLIDVTPQCDESGIELVRGFLQLGARGFDTIEEGAASVSDFMGRPRRADVTGLVRFMRRDESGRWFWRWDPRMAADAFVRPPSEQVLMEEAARRVGVPVLLIRAGESELVRAEDVEHFRRLLPTLQVVEVPGIRHMITGDSNAAFMPPVIDFLRGL